MPQGVAELLRQMATQIENKVYPHELGWGSLLGHRFEMEIDSEEWGTANSTVRIGEEDPFELFQTFEFIEGDETLPWWEDYTIKPVSISAKHKITEVSAVPGKSAWFLFSWPPGSASEMGKVRMFATDGECWVPILDYESGASLSRCKPEVTYDMSKDQYLTTGDLVAMSDRITKFLDKFLAE